MSNRFITGTRKGLFIHEKRQGDWKVAHRAFAGVKVPMVLGDPRDGTIYAAVDHGHFGTKMHRSGDGGATWDELPPLAYPPKPDDVPEIRDAFRDKVVPWSLEMVWALEPGGAEEPGVLWCGTIPGGLFRSQDSGQTWSLVRSLWDVKERAHWAGGGYDFPGIHSICVDPRDPRRLTVAISCGGVWRTEDGGESWSLVGKGLRAEYMPPELAYDQVAQDPHRMVACAAAPHHLWIQHHNGIFRSSDGADSWEEITDVAPSSFGFAVAVHPEKPDTAWFAPAVKDEKRYPSDGRLVVTRTIDGGRTFQSFSAGLPAEDAWHLIYRHCLEVDDTGENLVMGSTTGSLWTSGDAGESWNRLSADLPPVYCTRWMA